MRKLISACVTVFALTAPLSAQIQAGDIVLLTSSGLTHIRGGTSTPVVPVPLDGNAIPTNWGDGSIEWVSGTQTFLAGAGLAPYGIFLLNFTSSLSAPTSVRLATGVAAVRDIDIEPSTGDALVLQGSNQFSGRIDRFAAPVTVFSSFSGTPFAGPLTISQGDFMAVLDPTTVLYGAVANTYSVTAGSTTGGTLITLGGATIFYSMVSADRNPGADLYVACFNPDYVRRLNAFGPTTFTDAGSLIQSPECDGPEDVEYDNAGNIVWVVSRNGSTISGVPWGAQTGNDNAIVGVTLDLTGNPTGFMTAGPPAGHGNTGFFANIAVVGVSPASVSFTGMGCNGSNGLPLVLGNIGTPQIGSSSFQVVVANGAPFASAAFFLAVGLAPAPIPVSPTCNLYLDFASLSLFIGAGVSPILLPLDASGGLQFAVPITNNPALQGTLLDIQVAASDSVPGGFTTSNAMRLNFGP